MASTARPTLNQSSPLPPSPPQPRLRGRLGRWLGRKPLAQQAIAPMPEVDPLLAAGRQLRQRREERGLSLRQLALDTRISAAVLEALERGWSDRLPEATYLRTMLPLIERHLALPPGCLDPMLARGNQLQARQQRQSNLLRFTPGSIDVFTTWQGTVLYGVLTLALIYGLNLQQRKIAAQGLLASQPIPPLPAKEQATPPSPKQALLKLYPDLRPLEQAARGQGASQLRRWFETSP
jgi:hypothetical protein